MLDVARTVLARGQLRAYLGSVDKMLDVEDSSVDLVLCINTLGYLDEVEQQRFFEQCGRVLREAGNFIIMTGNELLDFFALNSGTAQFFERNFGVDVSGLLTQGKDERWLNASRANPLAFKSLLAVHGFREVGQAFSQWHSLPPGLALLDAAGDVVEARNAARGHSVDAAVLPEGVRWQALFRCSMFASLSVKL